MKNEFKLDRSTLFSMVHDSVRDIEKSILGKSKYGDASEYLRVSKMFTELGNINRVDRSVKTAQDAFLKEGIANFASAIILSGYLNSSDIKGRIEDEEIDLIIQTLELLLEKAVPLSDGIRDLQKLKITIGEHMKTENEKEYGGYNPLENPHGGKK